MTRNWLFAYTALTTYQIELSDSIAVDLKRHGIFSAVSYPDVYIGVLDGLAATPIQQPDGQGLSMIVRAYDGEQGQQ